MLHNQHCILVWWRHGWTRCLHTDDGGQCVRLPLLRHQLPDGPGKRGLPGGRRHGAALHRHHLWALWVNANSNALQRLHAPRSPVSGVPRYYGHILLANISCVDIAYYTDCFYYIYFHIYIYFWVFDSYLHYSSLLCTFCVITHINHLGLIEYIWSYLL